jgi:hypothetical protein
MTYHSCDVGAAAPEDPKECGLLVVETDLDISLAPYSSGGLWRIDAFIKIREFVNLP